MSRLSISLSMVSVSMVLVMSLCGCVTPKGSGMASLSREEQNMFFRCLEEVSQSECSDTLGDQVAKQICENELQDVYAGARDRRRWLLQHGCLPETVDNRPR